MGYDSRNHRPMLTSTHPTAVTVLAASHTCSITHHRRDPLIPRDFTPGEPVVFTGYDGFEHRGTASYVPIQPSEAVDDDDAIYVTFDGWRMSLPVPLSRVRPAW